MRTFLICVFSLLLALAVYVLGYCILHGICQARHNRFENSVQLTLHQGGYNYATLETDCGTYYLPDKDIAFTAYNSQVEDEGEGMLLTAEPKERGFLRTIHRLSTQPEKAEVNITTTLSLAGVTVASCTHQQLFTISLCCFFTPAIEESRLRDQLQATTPGSPEHTELVNQLRANLRERLQVARHVKDRDTERQMAQALEKLDQDNSADSAGAK